MLNKKIMNLGEGILEGGILGVIIAVFLGIILLPFYVLAGLFMRIAGGR